MLSPRCVDQEVRDLLVDAQEDLVRTRISSRRSSQRFSHLETPRLEFGYGEIGPVISSRPYPRPVPDSLRESLPVEGSASLVVNVTDRDPHSTDLLSTSRHLYDSVWQSVPSGFASETLRDSSPHSAPSSDERPSTYPAFQNNHLITAEDLYHSISHSILSLQHFSFPSHVPIRKNSPLHGYLSRIPVLCMSHSHRVLIRQQCLTVCHFEGADCSSIYSELC